MRRSLFLKSAAAALTSSAVVGCGTVNRVMSAVGLAGTRLAWREVVIAAADGANRNTPVAVDIVLVLEESALEKLAALPAAKWFQTRADMLRTFPGSYSYKSWEVSPGQTLRIAGDDFGTPSVVGVFVFADYLTPGEHRMRVEQLQNRIIVALEARGFSVSAFRPE